MAVDFGTSIAIAGQILKALQGFFFLVLPLLLVAGLLFYKKRLTLFPIAAIILERRDNNLLMKTDRIGRVRIDGIWKYKFRKSKETIPNPDYNWIVSGTYTPTNLFEKLANWVSSPVGFCFFYKYGSQQYKPINIKLKDVEGKDTGNFKQVFKPITDENGNRVYIKSITQINPFKKMVIPEFDIIDWDNMNFLVQEHASSEERRKKKDDFIKKVLIPLVTIAVAAIVLIVAMYFAVQLVQFGAGSVGSAATQVVEQAQAGGGVPLIGGLMPT